MSAIFSWKPSLVGPRYEVRVDSAGAEATRGSKTRKVRFSSVTGGRLLELYMRTSSVSLVLMHKGKDGVTKFVINHGGRVSDASYDENAAAFVAASAEILEYLAKARPETQISLGGGTGVRATMAMLGISMAVMGALLVIIPLVHSPSMFGTRCIARRVHRACTPSNLVACQSWSAMPSVYGAKRGRRNGFNDHHAGGAE